MPHKRFLGAVLGAGLLLTTAVPVTAQATTGGHGRPGNVAAVRLAVDGRGDAPLGIGNPSPTLS